MHLQLNERERAVFESLRESGEGEVLVAFFQRLSRELTNSRKVTGATAEERDLQREAGVKASDIIEENLIKPLSRAAQPRGEHDRFD